MVNAAFPPNETNARAMETGISLLRSMADRGNTYLSSRHSLLLELRAAIGPKPYTSNDQISSSSNEPGPITPSTGSRHIMSPTSQEADVPNITADVWQNPPDLPSLQDISFQIDPNDDSALWEGALNQIDIDMDTDWIENTLRR